MHTCRTSVLKKGCRILFIAWSGLCVAYAATRDTCHVCGKNPCTCHKSAQDSCVWSLTGTVVDIDRNEPIPFTSLWIRELQKGVVANKKGRFRVNQLCSGWYNLEVRHVGYEALQLHLHVPSKDTILALRALDTHLSEVEIQSAQRKALLRQEGLDATDLDAARDLGDFLEQIPGIHKLSTGSHISKPVIDGLHGQRIVILSHEIAQEAQQWGVDHAPPIDVLGIHRVELLRGANKFKYSPGALGGVLLVEPLPLSYDRDSLQGKGMTRLSSNGRKGEIFGQLSNTYARQNDWKVAYNGYFSAKRGGDLQAPSYYLANTAIQELSGAAEVGVQRKTWDASLYYSSFSTTLGILKSSHIGSVADLESAIALGYPADQRSFQYTINNPKQRNSHAMWKNRIQFNLSGTQKIKTLLAYQSNLRQEYENRRGRAAGRPSTHLRLRSYDAQVHWEVNTPQRKTSTGLSAHSRININVPGTGRTYFLPDYTMRRYSTFFVTHAYRERYSWESALRYDYVTQKAYLTQGQTATHNMHLVSGLLGFTQHIGKFWELHTHTSLDMRMPSIAERYSQGVHHGLASIEEGEPTLRREVGVKIGAHLHMERPEWHMTIRGHYQFIDHFIYQEVLPRPRLTIRGAFPVLQYRQSNATIHGLDVNIFRKIHTNLEYKISGTALWGWNQSQNTYLVLMPQNRLQQSLIYQFKIRQTDVKIEGSHLFVDKQRRYPKDSDLLEPPASYHLFDAVTSIKFHRTGGDFTLKIGVENILNRQYRQYLNRLRYYADEVGRNIWLSLGVSY